MGSDHRLSDSKVLEVTGVVDVLDEQRLAHLALTATASQLARMISGSVPPTGCGSASKLKRAVRWHERDDGMIDFRARLPKEDAAVLIAALEAARDQSGPPPKPDPAAEPCQPVNGVGAQGRRACGCGGRVLGHGSRGSFR
jgi:hypothetical protein